MNNQTVEVFFSVDENYVPFLAVAIHSLIENLSPKRRVNIHILNSGLSENSIKRLQKFASDRVKITPVDVTRKLAPLAAKLNLRDYYTVSIYFRLFIAALFPQYHKAIYLDADIVVNGDIAALYDTQLGNHLVGAIPDAVIASRQEFRDYAELGVGIPFQRYFNSGVMLMNLDQFREQQIESRFVELLNTYHFDTVCPDQDYLNVLCRDQVLYLDNGWNKMAIDNRYNGVPNVVHYNNFFKPWQYDNINYQEHFWRYAEQTEFYDEILAIRRNFDHSKVLAHRKATRELVSSVLQIIHSDCNFRCVLHERQMQEIPFLNDFIPAGVVYEA